MSRISSGIAISASSLTSWRISSIGKSGERSSGPTGSPVPGCSTGCAAFGMSAAMLYQRLGRSDSASRYFVCSTGARILPLDVDFTRNTIRCARMSAVPVATAAKVEALSVDFRSQAALAEILGVSRSRVTRWLKGAGIDPLNAEKVDLLELVWSNLLRVYEPEAARSWLWGVNPLLGDRRPIDLVRAGRAEELMRAIRAERADSFA